jgi:MinD superfamily P-loop ATPase
MKQITIISGKGGTGKTTVAGALAVLAQGKVIADGDVDAPNLHLILAPSLVSEEEFSGASTVVKDEELCTECGLCREHCRFNAVTAELAIDPLRCEGCGVCAYVCPTGALRLVDDPTGYIHVADTRYGPFVHARLRVGAEASGKLVHQVRVRAREIAERKGLGLVILDGSPGIGCPVIASLSGADLALVVTEPTLSAMADLERVVGVARHFGVEALVCINKYDLNLGNARRIERYCQEEGLGTVGTIPFDEKVPQSIRQGVPVVEYPDSPAAQAIEAMWRSVRESWDGHDLA